MILDYSDFYNRNNVGWSDFTYSGVEFSQALFSSTMDVQNGYKRMQGKGSLIDKFGMLRDPGVVSQTGYIYQMDMTIEPEVITVVSLGGIGTEKILHDTNTVSTMFNSFLPTERIRLNDYGEGKAAGSNVYQNLDREHRYTIKFLINANGTCSAYFTDNFIMGSFYNFYLGDSVIATNLRGVTIYFVTNQTHINPLSSATVWDNFFVHDQGLDFQPPPRKGADLESQSWSMKKLYSSNG